MVINPAFRSAFERSVRTLRQHPSATGTPGAAGAAGLRIVVCAIVCVLLCTSGLFAQSGQPVSEGAADDDLLLRSDEHSQMSLSADREREAMNASWADDPFAEGNRYWSLRFAASSDSHLGEIYQGQIAAGKYIDDDLAIYLGLTVGYADARAHRSGFLGGPEIGIRWHFLQRDDWSLFLDASSGVVLHEHPITEDSLRFNFNLQAGVGATYQLSDRMLLQGGVAWHHLSNARVRGKEHNLGYDGPMGYLGVVMPF